MHEDIDLFQEFHGIITFSQLITKSRQIPQHVLSDNLRKSAEEPQDILDIYRI